MDYLIGTCGYAYPQWKGVFYPQGTKEEDFLTFYASRFPAVEVDSTFYRMPTAKQLSGMLAHGGGNLRFSIKAPRTLTHEIGVWKQDATLFKDALEPMMADGSLTALLFQFPQSFRYEPDNRVYLAGLLAEFSGYPSVVEFRSDAWMQNRVYDGLEARGAGICVCDLPSLRGLPKLVPVATGGRGYIRFHGRNAGSWYGDSAVARYDYLYSETELASFVPAIRAIKGKTKTIHLFFNNHPAGNATVNAKTMMEILGEQ